MQIHRVITAALFTSLLWLATAMPVSAEETDRAGHVGVGVGFGPMFGTDEGAIMGVTVFGDYYVNHEVAFGPLLQIGFDGDFTQVGLSGQAKYLIDVAGNPALHPHVQAGLGFIHASNGSSDTEWLMPIGGGIEVDLGKNLTLGTTLLINVSGLRDDIFLNWFFGFKLLL